MKKRKIKIFRLFLVLLIPIVVVGILFCIFFVNFHFLNVSSIHEDALTYKNSSCMVFYPNGSKGNSIAKTICKENKIENKIYDYVLIPYGDYYLVDYGNGYSYYVDKEMKDIVIEEVNDFGKQVISDYLRYTVKKYYPDLYNVDFLKESTAKKIDFNNATYSLFQDNVVCKLEDYDFEIEIPLKYMQEALSMDFGYQDVSYRKPIYIDPNKQVIALTFHNGPNFEVESKTSSEAIVDILYEYDCVATFFVIGDNLKENVWTKEEIDSFLLNSIQKGNEYGSFQQTGNVYLTELSNSEILQAIEGPMNYFKNNLNYEMKLYRPIGMDRDERVDEVSPYPAILWNVDANDYDNEDEDEIYHNIMDNLDDGDVIAMNDIFESSANVVERIVPELIEKGYELVSVSDLIHYLGIKGNIDYFFDSNYYE